MNKLLKSRVFWIVIIIFCIITILNIFGVTGQDILNLL